MRSLIIENATAILIAIGLVIAMIPSIRHWHLYMKLQVSLVSRLGQIWDESPYIRGPKLLENSYLEELQEIEKRFGEQLTDQEKAWLAASRRQKEIASKWIMLVIAIFLPAIFAVSYVVR